MCYTLGRSSVSRVFRRVACSQWVGCSAMGQVDPFFGLFVLVLLSGVAERFIVTEIQDFFFIKKLWYFSKLYVQSLVFSSWFKYFLFFNPFPYKKFPSNCVTSHFQGCTIVLYLSDYLWPLQPPGLCHILGNSFYPNLVSVLCFSCCPFFTCLWSLLDSFRYIYLTLKALNMHYRLSDLLC